MNRPQAQSTLWKIIYNKTLPNRYKVVIQSLALREIVTI